jgi:hypothetical protein
MRLNHRLFLIALFLVVFGTSCNVSKKYAEQAKVWEKNISKFEELDKSEQYPKDAVIFAGSSSIALWSTIKEDMAPYSVIHRGFGGSKFSDLACYIDRIVYPHSFEALVIYEANDITGGKADKTPKEVASLFKYIVKKVRKKYADQPIFVIEITPTKSRWKAWPKIKEANMLLEETCKKMHNVYFIPTSSYYLNEKGEPRTELARPDMLHQNREGYLIWTKLIKAKLDEVLKKRE